MSYDPKAKVVYCVYDPLVVYGIHSKEFRISAVVDSDVLTESIFEKGLILKTRSYYEARNSPILEIYRVMNG